VAGTPIGSFNVNASAHSATIQSALLLERITIAWMIIEAAAAIGAGIIARSLLLVAFGIDSGIELASAIVVYKRFRLEAKEKCEQFEHTTARVAGYLLLLLSIYVIVQAIFGLVSRRTAETSPVGIAVAVIAAFAMPVLARAKFRLTEKIESRALRADAMETLTCGYLSWILLVGLVLNALSNWWWIDSVAALAIVPPLIREGLEVV
jgi:divalent metal cation (Fe/Co/Zn/Cd) transporter